MRKILLTIISVFAIAPAFAQFVGIGTSTPAQKLHIAGSANTLRIEGLKSTGSFYTAPGASTSRLVFVDVNGDFRSIPETGTSPGNVLTLDGSGIISWMAPATSGTVSSVSVVTANGISGSVSSPTVNPAITLTLGAITPTSVAATGNITAGGNMTATGTIGGSNFSGTSSGTNTGNQTITLTSDVTGSGTGSFVTTIANNAVTYGKMQVMTTNKLLGSGAGTAVSEIGLGTGLSFVSGNLTVSPSGIGALTTVTADAPLTGAGTSGSHLSIPAANGSTNGYLTSTDWTTFNNKQNAFSTASLTTTTTGLTITGANNLVTNAGTINIQNATTSQNGLLTSTDWNTFNGKENVLTFNNGLTRTTNTITLGGTLLANTDIPLNSKTLTFSGTGIVALSSVGGQFALGSATPTSGYLQTITTNSTNGGGISMTLAGGAATSFGVNMSTASTNYDGLLYTNTSATNSSFYGVGSILSGGNIVSGYEGYRTGSGNSYGIYGVNGVPGTYATGANTWAAFLQGRTVISSESSPTSPIGTDLEIRNTTVSATAPVTLSMRQTNSVTTTGNLLTDIDFGDNKQTGPEAEIQVVRGASGTVGANDFPTDMIFSTSTDNPSATPSVLTERMRILNTGAIAFNGAANTGTAGQVLTSAGAGTPPTWSLLGQSSTVASGTSTLIVSSGTNVWTLVPGLTQTITIPANATVLLSTNGMAQTTSVSNTGYSAIDLAFFIDGSIFPTYPVGATTLYVLNTAYLTGTFLPWSLNATTTLSAGSHTILVASIWRGGTAAANVSGTSASIRQGSLIVTVLKN